MIIFTTAELEFLSNLNVNWGKLYRKELTALLQEVDKRGLGQNPASSPRSTSPTSDITSLEKLTERSIGRVSLCRLAVRKSEEND
jgi:hypothetical protein